MENKEKVSKFATVLSQLRKERGISQKQAAADLKISQALLSHYEKGIRECGLDFVIRCSEYYGVTADYLLGISDSRTGIDAIGSCDCKDGEKSKLAFLADATRMLLSLMPSTRDEKVTKYVYDYYTLCVYRGAVTMARAGILPKEMFKFDFNLGRELASAAIAVEDAKFVFIEDKSRTGSDLGEKTSLHSLIESAEELILTNFVV
ncbi:MAG: helix-turn-helix transcriptional regulator [Eubacterium sp.]|nr:helix-turn-helix transcriptional regulator [Eubacterium sp.]